MYKYGEIAIKNAKTEKYRTIGNYTSNAFSCDIVLKTETYNKKIAEYTCVYTLKKSGDKYIMDNPRFDMCAKLEYANLSDEWGICVVTEIIPSINFAIKADFNIYRQLQPLGNKKFFQNININII